MSIEYGHLVWDDDGRDRGEKTSRANSRRLEIPTVFFAQEQQVQTQDQREREREKRYLCLRKAS